jgi:hypothetical protein
MSSPPSIAGAELAGHIRSTSVFPPSVLGDRAAAFDTDLAASLGPLGDNGVLAILAT